MYLYKEKYTIDFRDARSYADIHDIIKKELDFPDHYGKNLDAFWDCLTDMVGRKVHIEILNLDAAERILGAENTRMFISTLKDFKHYQGDRYYNDILIEIVSGQTRVSLT